MATVNFDRTLQVRLLTVHYKTTIWIKCVPAFEHPSSESSFQILSESFYPFSPPQLGSHSSLWPTAVPSPRTTCSVDPEK